MSDPQAQLKGVCTRAAFERVLAHVGLTQSDADLLIVTGDLTHDELLETYQTLYGLLGGWLPNLRVIPGNHDDRALMRQVFGECIQVVGDRNVFAETLGEWRLIGLDSHVPGERHGELGSEQLTWLEGELQAAPQLYFGLFVHHPPVDVNSPWLDEIALRDGQDLLNLAWRHPEVRFISCGHVHQERMVLRRGIPILTAPATGLQFQPDADTLIVDIVRPGYRIFDFLPRGEMQTRVVRVPLAGE